MTSLEVLVPFGLTQDMYVLKLEISALSTVSL